MFTIVRAETDTLLKLNKENKYSLVGLGKKMEQSLSDLESIRKLLVGTTIEEPVLNEPEPEPVPDHPNQKDLQDLQQKYEEALLESGCKEEFLYEKAKLLLQAEEKIEELQQSLDLLSKKYDALSIKHDADMENWQRKCDDTEDEAIQLKLDYGDLFKKNQNLEDEVSQLEDLHEREVQMKEQLELLLRENAQEQKIITQGVLERDQRIEDLEENIRVLREELTEKDILLDEYINKFQIDPKEYQCLQEKVEQLEEENHRTKRRLNNLNELYHHKEETEKKKLEQTASFSISTSKNSRIPKLTTSNSTTIPQHNNDLEKKLEEKILQNKELENAMERTDKHCIILRTSLNETREESADRYRKMLFYMEENRVLKEQLNRCQ